tara:strand:- start:89 stop:709 length:621 start_codon:yes stop_codon:yes gene_type:complete
MKAMEALTFFDVYLNLLRQTEGTNIKSVSSVSTYSSCASQFCKTYASDYQLQHVLTKEFLLRTAKEDNRHGSLKRHKPQIKCGLRHFVRMYELCCQQFHPQIKQIFQPKKLRIHKRKRCHIVDHKRLHSEMVRESATDFVKRYKRGNEHFPTKKVGMVNFLCTFEAFFSDAMTRKCWEKSGVSLGELMANTRAEGEESSEDSEEDY